VIRFFRHYVPLNLLIRVLVEALILGGAIYAGVSARILELSSLFERENGYLRLSINRLTDLRRSSVVARRTLNSCLLPRVSASDEPAFWSIR